MVGVGIREGEMEGWRGELGRGRKEKGGRGGPPQRHSHTLTVWSTLPVTTKGVFLWKSERGEEESQRSGQEGSPGQVARSRRSYPER